jgi:hypothetical protein
MDKVVFSIFGDIEIDAELDAAPDAEFHAPIPSPANPQRDDAERGTSSSGRRKARLQYRPRGEWCTMYVLCKYTETSKIKIVGNDDEQDIIAGAIWRHNAAKTSFTEMTVTEMVQLR